MSYDCKDLYDLLAALTCRVEKLENCAEDAADPFKGDETVRVTFSKREAEQLWTYLKGSPELYAPTVKIGQALGLIP